MKSNIKLTICRNGQFLEVPIELYDLETHQIKRMVSFGGVTLFEADDYLSRLTGMPPNMLTFYKGENNNIFKNIEHLSNNFDKFCLNVLSINEHPIHNLNELIQQIPTIKNKRYFTIDYINFLPVYTFDGWYTVRHTKNKANVAYDENTPEPKLYTFNMQTRKWDSVALLSDRSN